MTPTVTFLTKPGCHLCDDARIVLERVCLDLGITWTELDITADPALREQWWEQIPVTLIDNRQHDYWRLDETRFRAALADPDRQT